MLDNKNLFDLAMAAIRTQPGTNYSYNGESLSNEAINETLRDELNSMVGTYSAWRENKNKVFALMEQIITEVEPQKVLDRYGMFAETKVYPQGTKPIFTRKLGRRRAKQFITKVGLAGRYEVFKLDETNFELETSAIGGGVQIALEEFLDGRVNMAELVNIVMEGMDEEIYREVAAALVEAIDSMQPANVADFNTFKETEMDTLIAVASAYGTPTIYCTREFAATMIPATGWISENMKDAMWNQGYLGNYKGTRVIVLPQSFEDDTNTVKVLDPGYAWIIPTGDNERPVKIAFEGSTQVKSHDNDDWSTDMMFYQKVGVGVIMTNNICVYHNSSLTK